MAHIADNGLGHLYLPATDTHVRIHSHIEPFQTRSSTSSLVALLAQVLVRVFVQYRSVMQHSAALLQCLSASVLCHATLVPCLDHMSIIVRVCAQSVGQADRIEDMTLRFRRKTTDRAHGSQSCVFEASKTYHRSQSEQRQCGRLTAVRLSSLSSLS